MHLFSTIWNIHVTFGLTTLDSIFVNQILKGLKKTNTKVSCIDLTLVSEVSLRDAQSTHLFARLTAGSVISHTCAEES